jgi:hypothetical protein
MKKILFLSFAILLSAQILSLPAQAALSGKAEFAEKFIALLKASK